MLSSVYTPLRRLYFPQLPAGHHCPAGHAAGKALLACRVRFYFEREKREIGRPTLTVLLLFFFMDDVNLSLMWSWFERPCVICNVSFSFAWITTASTLLDSVRRRLRRWFGTVTASQTTANLRTLKVSATFGWLFLLLCIVLLASPDFCARVEIIHTWAWTPPYFTFRACPALIDGVSSFLQNMVWCGVQS